MGCALTIAIERILTLLPNLQRPTLGRCSRHAEAAARCEVPTSWSAGEAHEARSVRV
jgi:hypothetical protein